MFLTTKAPIGGIRPALVSETLRRVCVRCGVEVIGAHRLRHGLATDMLRRGPSLAYPLLAQSAIDRLQAAAHELVLDGESYRQRQKPTVTAGDGPLDGSPPARRSSRRRR